MADIAVSIIVPVYNTSKYLKKCLDTLSSQTLKNIEIIVVDDGSTDDSPAICDSYAGDSRFVILHNQNQGPSGSRNDGIKQTHGEYCMFVDSDDWVEQDACEKLYLFAKQTNADLVIGGHVNESTAGSTIRYIFPETHEFTGKDYKDNILIHTLGLIGKNIKNPAKLDKLTPVWSRLYRTSVIRDNGIEYIELKKLPSECLQFNFEFCVNAKKAVYLHEVVYHYRRNTTDSVTKPYRDDLWAKWKWWIDYEKKYLEENYASEDLWKAYYSRICCGVIPLGGNAVKLKSYKEVKNECKRFLSQESFKEAFNNFDYSVCPIYWRVFFDSAKKQNTTIFILLTKAMRKLLEKRKK